MKWRFILNVPFEGPPDPQKAWELFQQEHSLRSMIERAQFISASPDGYVARVRWDEHGRQHTAGVDEVTVIKRGDNP